MSSNTGTFTFDRPETIDDATYSRIVFIRPLELAVQPIIDHNMELIGTVRRLRPWYRGEHDAMEPELLSTLLDPDANHACDMLKAFIAIVKRYNPGEFPAHCCKMRELEFTTRYLIHELEKCFDSPAFTNAVTQLGHLIFTWSAPNAGMYSFFDWVTRLDTRLERLIRSFADIAEACRRRERERDSEIAFSALPPATVKDVQDAADRIGDQVAATGAETVRAVRRAKREVIKDAHTARKSEADRRLPKGERGRQIAAVRNLVREAREKGKSMTLRRSCLSVWRSIKGGYPSVDALYNYCHRHETEF